MARDGAMSAFAGPPQPIEVFHRGAWYRGELLGWRHDADGRCSARVRCVLNGLRHSAWVDLDLLRLPRVARRTPAATTGAAPVAAARGPAPAAAPLVADAGELDGIDDETRPHVLLPKRSPALRAGLPMPPSRGRALRVRLPEPAATS